MCFMRLWLTVIGWGGSIWVVVVTGVRKMLSRHLVCAGIMVMLSLASVANALTLAVFPVEDLSQGHNGVNHELTSYLSWDMDRRGFDVISSDAVISFMGRNRVRWLGFLDTRHILLAKEELGADLVLFGTM